MIWKPATIALSVALAISGGAYWLKDRKVSRLENHAVQMAGEINALTATNKTLAEQVAKSSKVNQSANKTSKEISKVTANDKEVADFLATPVPNGLRSVLQGAYQ